MPNHIYEVDNKKVFKDLLELYDFDIVNMVYAIGLGISAHSPIQIPKATKTITNIGNLCVDFPTDFLTTM